MIDELAANLKTFTMSELCFYARVQRSALFCWKKRRLNDDAIALERVAKGNRSAIYKWVAPPPAPDPDDAIVLERVSWEKAIAVADCNPGVMDMALHLATTYDIDVARRYLAIASGQGKKKAAYD
jgi:hypothetical protein